MDNHLYSLGAHALITALQNLKEDYRSPNWDVILLNLSTLIRNNINKNLSDQDIVNGTFQDMDNVIDACVSFLLDRKVPSSKPMVIVYLPRYNIPATIRRTPATLTSRITTIQTMLEKKYLKNIFSVDVLHVRKVPCLTMCVGFKQYPYIELYDYIYKNYTTGIINKLKLSIGLSEVNLGMVSHCPLDLHLAKYFTKLQLLESYTGAVKSPSQFGAKVFSQASIPFNEITHALFGDSIHVKGFVTRSNKKAIVDLSVNHRWFMKKGSDIIADLVTNQFITPATIKQIHL